jgi:hypothetical protein
MPPLTAGPPSIMLAAKTLTMLFLCVGTASPILACSCVFPVDPANPETSDQMFMRTSSVIFRGVVVGKRKLPASERIHGSVYVVTYRVNEYWKGSPAREVVIYGMADVFPGRCEGWGDVSVGKEYLIYAFEREVQDEYSQPDRTWIEYVDVIPKGTKIMTVGACTPSGQVSRSEVDPALRKLGPGTKLKQSN